MIRDALAALRARRGMTLLAALGVLAASLVVGTAMTVGYSLATGFDRSAERAQLPDVIARLKPLGIEAIGNSSDEFARILAADIARWGEVAKAGNIRIEQ